MARKPSASTLYKLIHAGHLARQALLAPLMARGLEAGDDAILLVLEPEEGMSRDTLIAETGLGPDRLDERLARLEDKGLLLRMAVGPEMVPGARLSQQGRTIRQAIEDHWTVLEQALSEDLGEKHSKQFRKRLKRIITLLDL